jgi:protocatechuate 4,5-dioxygenase alpha chain
MKADPDYENIPGTYVYDARRGRLGYALNMFCMSLNKAENRTAFKADEAAYLDRFKLTPEQRDTVLRRDWLGMLQVGGNIYYTIKIAFCDGLTFQDVAGMMSGVPKDTYAQMMLAGGRSPEGNRYKVPPTEVSPGAPSAGAASPGEASLDVASPAGESV